MRSLYSAGHADLSEIGTELALPFIKDYVRRRNLPLNLEAIEGVEWIGAWYAGSLRAVGGIRDLRDAFPTWRYIYGFYGDGSARQNVGMHAIGKALLGLPWGLVGVIVFDNLSMIRVAKKHGFEITPDPEEKYVYVKRPPKLDVLKALRDGEPAWVNPTPAA